MADVVKLAASLILIRPRIDSTYELLLMKRKKGMVFSQAQVFPGGVWESSDSLTHWGSYIGRTPEILPKTAHSNAVELNSLRIAAIRETFEESGIFIGSGDLGPPVTGDFLRLCMQRHAKPDLSRLHYLWRVVTPYGFKPRFDTVFFVAVVPAGTEFTLTEESESAAWMSPLEVLHLAETRKATLLPPQVYLSIILSHHLSVEELLNALATVECRVVVPQIQVLSGGKGYLDIFPGDEKYSLETDILSRPGQRHCNRVHKDSGIEFHISPGVNPLVDCSKWRLVKNNHTFSLQPRSKL